MRRILPLVLAILVCGAHLNRAAEIAPVDLPAPHVEVARVEGESLTAADVYIVLEAAFSEQVFEEPISDRVLAESLRHAVNQRAVYQRLARAGFGPTAEQVDARLAALRTHVEASNAEPTGNGDTATANDTAWKHYLDRRRTTERAIRRRLQWEHAWRMYLDEKLTPEVLETFFKDHQREFDGTRLRTRHIVFAAKDANELQTAQAHAAALRLRIVAGEIDFAQAARQHSAAPSRANGGDIGWIARDEPMPESFARVAFSLEKDEISEPVAMSGGVHLIQWIELRPGERTWRDVAGRLRETIARRRFAELADEASSTTKIEFLSALPSPPLGRENAREK